MFKHNYDMSVSSFTMIYKVENNNKLLPVDRIDYFWIAQITVSKILVLWYKCC